MLVVVQGPVVQQTLQEVGGHAQVEERHDGGALEVVARLRQLLCVVLESLFE